MSRSFVRTVSLLLTTCAILCATTVMAAANAPPRESLSWVDASTHTRIGVLPTAIIVYLPGDSITDGRYEVPGNTYAWWRDGYAVLTSQLICGMYCDGQVIPVKHGGGCAVATNCFGSPATTWFTPEVLDAFPAPTTVIFEMGWNDLGRITDAQFTAGMVLIMAQAAARGVTFIAGTVNPTCKTAPNWALNEPQRKRWNTWLRDNRGPNVADFAAMLQLPDGSLDPRFALDGCKVGTDFIHPGPFGALRMAQVVPRGQIT
jgi:hypothetical protein